MPAAGVVNASAKEPDKDEKTDYDAEKEEEDFLDEENE